jgi:outer membrane receptor protein involved in Fe transport
MVNATITRIATIVPGNTLIYNIFQNAGKSRNTGAEITYQQQFSGWFSFNTSAALYKNTIDAFIITNRYPLPTTYVIGREDVTSWNTKLNGMFKLPKKAELQFSAIYLAPDIIPQGKIGSRFSVDFGLKKQVQNGRGELFLNGTDVFNTLSPKRELRGNGFTFVSRDYLETQVFRLGYSYKF